MAGFLLGGWGLTKIKEKLVVDYQGVLVEYET